ncbi:hypothetical protein D3C72_2279550 [compost metagenome]
MHAGVPLCVVELIQGVDVGVNRLLQLFLPDHRMPRHKAGQVGGVVPGIIRIDEEQQDFAGFCCPVAVGLVRKDECDISL